MIIKVCRSVTRPGSGSELADYLVGELDSSKRERAGVQVLRGDPELVGEVADSLPFKNRHLHAVIAWAPEDKPTDAQIAEVLEYL